MAVCGSCGGDLREGARFCGTCGQPTSAPAGKSRPAGPATTLPPTPGPTGKVQVDVAPPTPPPRPPNRTPVIIAALGALAVVLGVVAGLVVASSDGGSGGEEAFDDPDGAEAPSDAAVLDEITMILARGPFSTEEAVVVEAAFDPGPEAVERVVVLLDGEPFGEFDPSQPIELEGLPSGRHDLRLVAELVDGSTEESRAERILVQRPVLGNRDVPEGLRAVAERFAAALADGDWALVRQMDGSRSGVSDGEFQQDWGNVGEHFVAPVRTEGPELLRVLLIAHQHHPQDQPGGSPQTSAFCQTWRIGPGTPGTVAQGAGPTSTALDGRPGWEDPSSIADEFLNGC